MRYRRLDDNYDFVFGHGKADYFRDIPDAPGQAVLTRLRLFTLEWFNDLSEGTPYRTRVLGKYTENAWVSAMKRRIRETEGVLSLDLFGASFDRDARKVTFNAEITTIYGKEVMNQVVIDSLPLYGR